MFSTWYAKTGFDTQNFIMFNKIIFDPTQSSTFCNQSVNNLVEMEEIQENLIFQSLVHFSLALRRNFLRCYIFTPIQIYNNIVNRLLQAQVLITTRCFRPLLLTCVPCLYQQMNHSNNNFRDIITTL